MRRRRATTKRKTAARPINLRRVIVGPHDIALDESLSAAQHAAERSTRNRDGSEPTASRGGMSCRPAAVDNSLTGGPDCPMTIRSPVGTPRSVARGRRVVGEARVYVTAGTAF